MPRDTSGTSPSHDRRNCVSGSSQIAILSDNIDHTIDKRRVGGRTPVGPARPRRTPRKGLEWGWGGQVVELQAALQAEKERAHELELQLAAAQSAAAGSRTGIVDAEAAAAVPTPWDAVLGTDSGDDSPSKEPRADCRGLPLSPGDFRLPHNVLTTLVCFFRPSVLDGTLSCLSCNLRGRGKKFNASVVLYTPGPLRCRPRIYPFMPGKKLVAGVASLFCALSIFCSPLAHFVCTQCILHLQQYPEA